MEIGTMSAEEFAKSFSEQNQNQNNQQNSPQNQQTPKFEEIGVKSSEELAAESLKNPPATEGTKTPEELATEEATKVLADIEAKKNAGRPKTKLDDSFKQGLDKLFKEQKLDPYTDGKEGYLIPETWEDVVDLIDDNKKNWIESSKAKDKQELIDDILATKSPAWQFVLQNSESYKNPADLLPLLTAVQNIEYSNSLDPSKEQDQDKIIRATLSLQGLSGTDIESEIEDLRERGKKEARATSLKPILDRYNEAQAEKVLQEKEQEELKKTTFWNSYYQNLEDNIFKAKDIDGVKLKNEHKQLIASTLIPDEKLGGLPIYTVIDNLVAAGEFTKLAKIVLIGVDEKLFDNYFLTKKADKAADNIQRILRQSSTSAGASEFEEEGSKPKPIKKSSYGYFG